jgi:hypothetical protein
VGDIVAAYEKDTQAKDALRQKSQVKNSHD